MRETCRLAQQLLVNARNILIGELDQIFARQPIFILTAFYRFLLHEIIELLLAQFLHERWFWQRFSLCQHFITSILIGFVHAEFDLGHRDNLLIVRLTLLLM